MVAFSELLSRRHSVRAFSDRPVPIELVQTVLDWAQGSPSNCNAQPWQVTIAAGERRDRLRSRLVEAFDAGVAPSELPTPKFENEHRKRQVACALEMYGKLGVAREDKEGRRRVERRNFELFDAPCVAILAMHESFGVGVALDVGCWLMSFLLGLEAVGLAGCAQASLRCYADIVKDELGIAADRRVLCGVSFGYADPSAAVNQARMTRAPSDECVTLLGF